MKKTLFNLLFLLLCVSLAGYLPGMSSPLPLIGMSPVGVLGLGLVAWALFDLVLAPMLDGIEETKVDGKSELSYTIQGRKALVVQLVTNLYARLFPKAEKAKKSGKKQYEKKIKLS